MQSKELSFLKSQARKLRKLLRRYDWIHDFIIFGSSVKGKMDPRDLDVALIAESSNAAFIGEVKTAMDKEIKNVHLQVITYEDFIKSKLPYHIISEGYSTKCNCFLPDKLKVKRKALYSFKLDGLTQVQKVMFNKGLNAFMKSTQSKRIGKGALLVPVRASAEAEDLFRQWQRKIMKREFIEV